MISRTNLGFKILVQINMETIRMHRLVLQRPTDWNDRPDLPSSYSIHHLCLAKHLAHALLHLQMRNGELEETDGNILCKDNEHKQWPPLSCRCLIWIDEERKKVKRYIFCDNSTVHRFMIKWWYIEEKVVYALKLWMIAL